MKEIITLKTKTSKTYDLGGGKRRIVIDPTLTIQPPAKDSHLRADGPDNIYGGQTYINLNDRGTPDETWRGILEFDISELPAGATLNSANLQLYYYEYTGAPYVDPSGKTVWAYKLTRIDWAELQATWNNYKSATPWTSAGGDYVTSDPAGGSTVFPADYGWMTWNVLAIVQDAFDSEVSAEFLVKLETEGLGADYSIAKFHSKEYTTDPDLQPKLVIDYTVPAVVGRSFGFIIG